MSFLHTTARRKAADKDGRNPDDPLMTRRFKHALGGEFHKVPLYKPDEFRASALPFCPVLHVEHRIFNQMQSFNYDTTNEVKNAVSWFNGFYTTIGTDTHTHWQRVMARSARVSPTKVKPYGGWECTHCKKKLPPQFQPAPHDCGPYSESQFIFERKKTENKSERDLIREYRELGPYPEWDYIELTVTDGAFSGHIDWLEYFVDEDKWCVSDLKTGTLNAVMNPEKNLPVVKNIFQIEQYAYLLPLSFKAVTRIDEYCLLYQARDNSNKWHPYTVAWSQERKTRAEVRANRWKRGHGAASDFLKKFHNEQETYKDLIPVVDARPCLTDKSYLREMGPSFTYEKTECPNKALCTRCEGDTLAKRLYAVILDRAGIE